MSISEGLLAFGIVFYALSFVVEALNQVVLIPLKYGREVAAVKNKLSLIKIYIENDRFSFFLLYFLELGMPFLLILSFFNQNQVQFPALLIYLGVAAMCIGELIRLFAQYTLGKFFTYPVITTRSQKLVTAGPYKIVRHPGYLGGLLIMAGYGMITGILYAPVLALILISVAYAYRIHVEENALRKRFGKEYSEYSRRTNMIIPYLL